jgi:hypothetical protein
MGPDQSPMMLNVLPPSRASSLPQVRVLAKSCVSAELASALDLAVALDVASALDLAVALDVAVDLAFDLDLPHRKAERRFCVVGNPAWMPG